ncbi:hypothetical protein [Crocosphaera watsonii]|uniref:Uncharacterized protein n=3 Tax=Crocosphaera watsonii TaxID=263511 RepID=T2JTL4_CROWT|nr:hypothetical protein [Crocosphaera watsonii]EHJ09431.1 hypothetical protein CWATWH0003_B142 [Crocosphaera watsonii WH 0003]CCQ58865.1 hypothetical protein CWATWH0005_987 [Crocosphaera watsonii WH 0005]CCQ68555.1 hypothetical protein CWATWH0402_1356 [Crocosphaera watsonii WH 0402]
MVKYTLSLHTQDSPNKGYEYPVDLSQHYEDNPEKYFTPAKCQELQNHLQTESLCAIREHHLKQIIDTWIEDIQEGYRNTTIKLDLPLLSETNVDQIQDNGNQEIPDLFPPELTGIEPIEGMLPPLQEIYSP